MTKCPFKGIREIKSKIDDTIYYPCELLLINKDITFWVYDELIEQTCIRHNHDVVFDIIGCKGKLNCPFFNKDGTVKGWNK